MESFKIYDVKVSEDRRVATTIDTGANLEVPGNASDSLILERLLEDKWLTGRQADDLYLLWMSDRAGVYRKLDNLLLFELVFENENFKSYRQ